MVHLSNVVPFAADDDGDHAIGSDLSFDGIVDLSDVAVLAAHFGSSCG